MSFWDLQGQDDDSIQAILEKNPVDINALRDSPELIQSFRTKDEQLLTFLQEKQNLIKILETIFSCQDTRRSKKAFELFKTDSPLLTQLLQDLQLSEFCISYIRSETELVAGFATRLFVNAFEAEAEQTLNLFNSSSQVLPLLLTYSHLSCVHELLNSYISNSDPKNLWFIWSILLICSGRADLDVSPPSFWVNTPAVNFANAALRNTSINNSQKKNLLKLVQSFLEEKNNSDNNEEGSDHENL